jgi:two-component system chemotaxis response regulator CheY
MVPVGTAMMNLDRVDKNVRILVADDYPLTRDMIRSILRQAGFLNIIAVENGLMALDEIRSEEGVGLVICDWNMPSCSGLEVLQTVRSDERYKKLPFLMLTAEAYRENIVEAMSAGVSDYIAKPFTAATLCEKLELVLTGSISGKE